MSMGAEDIGGAPTAVICATLPDSVLVWGRGLRFPMVGVACVREAGGVLPQGRSSMPILPRCRPAAPAIATALLAAPSALAVPDIMNGYSAEYSTGGSQLTNSTDNPTQDGDRKAYLFTTPASGPTSLFTVQSARVLLNSANSAYPSAIEARAGIWSVSGGVPSVELVGATYSGTLTATQTWAEFLLPFVLSANTQYAFQLSVTSTSPNAFKWANMRPTTLLPTAYNGYSLDGALGYNNSASSWTVLGANSANNAFALVPSPGALVVGALAGLWAPSRRRR